LPSSFSSPFSLLGSLDPNSLVSLPAASAQVLVQLEARISWGKKIKTEVKCPFPHAAVCTSVVVGPLSWRSSFAGFARHETASPLLAAPFPGIAGMAAAAAPISVTISAVLGLVTAKTWAAGAACCAPTIGAAVALLPLPMWLLQQFCRQRIHSRLVSLNGPSLAFGRGYRKA
jgi:hypothetical protein